MFIEDIKAELEANKQARRDALEAELASEGNTELIGKLNEVRNELVAKQAEISGNIEAIDAEIVALTPVVEEYHPEIVEG